MDWNDLRYLLAIHRSGSLARAAAAIGVTKATVSRRIAALEESFDARLVDRTPEGMTVTAAGLAAVRAAEVMEAAAARVRDDVAVSAEEVVAGTVRFTAAPWLAERLVIPAIPRLRAAYPQLDLRIQTTHTLVDVAAREADLALRNVSPASGPLVCARVGELAGCVYASELYLERVASRGHARELQRHDLLAYEGIGGMPGFEWIARPEDVNSRVVFRAGDPAGLASAARQASGSVPSRASSARPTVAAT